MVFRVSEMYSSGKATEKVWGAGGYLRFLFEYLVVDLSLLISPEFPNSKSAKSNLVSLTFKFPQVQVKSSHFFTSQSQSQV